VPESIPLCDPEWSPAGPVRVYESDDDDSHDLEWRQRQQAQQKGRGMETNRDGKKLLERRNNPWHGRGSTNHTGGSAGAKNSMRPGQVSEACASGQKNGSNEIISRFRGQCTRVCCWGKTAEERESIQCPANDQWSTPSLA